jgi:hypothetical protein
MLRIDGNHAEMQEPRHDLACAVQRSGRQTVCHTDELLSISRQHKPRAGGFTSRAKDVSRRGNIDANPLATRRVGAYPEP